MLSVQGIQKTYKGLPVLQNVGFALAPGECLGVAGHNGSGKSTLLSIVAQTVRPDAGAIQADGRDVLGDRAFLRAQLGYVPQQGGLLEDLTAGETLRFWQKTYGLAGDPFQNGSVAHLLGLEALRNKRVGRMSGGMQKRLSIALALLHAPRYLLLDEALSALDRHHRQALLAYLRGFLARGGSVLYCSHNVEELAAVCSSVLVLRQGRVAFYDAIANFPTDSAVLDQLLNPPGGEALP